jgi:hypothetical protein
MIATSWVRSSSTPTSWTKSSIPATAYGSRNIPNLGAIMDDLNYRMDDAVCTMDDMVLNVGIAGGTTWTKS